MNVTFYELLYCHTTRCSKQSWLDQEVEREQLSLLPPMPPPLQAQALVSVCILREEEIVGGCNCVVAKFSAVMCEEVKNSTPAGPISTVLGP